MIHRRRQDGHKNSAADALSSDIREKLQGGTAISSSRLPPSDIVPFRALLLLHGCSFYTQHYKKNDPHDPRSRASCAGFKKVNSCSTYKGNRHPHHSLSVNAAHGIFIELLPFIFGAHIISGQEVACSAFGITEVSSHKKHQ